MSTRYARVLALSASSRCVVVCLERRIEHCFLIQKQTAGREVGPVPHVCRVFLLGDNNVRACTLQVKLFPLQSSFYTSNRSPIRRRLSRHLFPFSMVSLFFFNCSSMTPFLIDIGCCSRTIASVRTSACISSTIVACINWSAALLHFV